MKTPILAATVAILGLALCDSSHAAGATKAATASIPAGTINPQKIAPPGTVSDAVQLAGGRITGGWLENAADGSWRRVEFALQGNVGTVTFGDGKRGSRIPSAGRYAYSGPGARTKKIVDSNNVYSEGYAAADATPQLRARANQSSPVPTDIATRVGELGGNVRALQQLAGLKGIAEAASAFDAIRGSAADTGIFGDRPGGAPGRKGSGWKDPRAGVGRDGRASDGGDEVISSDSSANAGGRRSSSVTRHSDGSTTEVSSESNSDGSSRNERTEKDSSGAVTRRRMETTDSAGTSEVIDITCDNSTGVNHSFSATKRADGSWSARTNRVGTRTTPSETPYGGRGGFDEAWMDKSLPWLMDDAYVNWKRERDLVVSGGRVAQPGRGQQTSPATSDGPRVGTTAVTNCGDSGTNPCARTGGAAVDVRGRLGGLSQPAIGGPNGGPGNTGVPDPVPPVPVPTD